MTNAAFVLGGFTASILFIIELKVSSIAKDLHSISRDISRLCDKGLGR